MFATAEAQKSTTLLSRLSMKSSHILMGYFGGKIKYAPPSDQDGNDQSSHFSTVDPSNGALLCSLQAPAASFMDEHLGRSQAAFESWSSLPSTRRGAILHRFGELVEEGSGELGELIARDVGIPIAQTKENHVLPTADVLKYWGNLAMNDQTNPRRNIPDYETSMGPD